MKSYISHLECSVCAGRFPHTELHTICPSCGKVLIVRYNLTEAKKVLTKKDFSGESMWKYSPLLPIQQEEHIVSLGEGGTPLLPLKKIGSQFGLPNLLCKDESFNPTGSFKARGLSAAISKAKELGVTEVSMPSAGNAGSALAAYAAACGMQANVFIPRDTPEANKKELEIYGAKMFLVDGTIADAAKKMNEVKALHNWFDISTLKEPYRLEGKKTLGFELAEQLHWELPDVIVYPAGGGTGLIGMWKAFNELEQLGWIDSKRPKMVAVQSSGCAPVLKAFNEGKDVSEMFANAQTVASGLRVPKPFADYMMLKILRESKGTAVGISDDELLQMMKRVAQAEGIFMCPEGAATVAALNHLKENNVLSGSETVVVFNTASGLKYLELV